MSPGTFFEKKTEESRSLALFKSVQKNPNPNSCNLSSLHFSTDEKAIINRFAAVTRVKDD